jgi:hypothetical protein
MEKGSHVPKFVAAVAVAAIGAAGWFGWKWIDGPAHHDATPVEATSDAPRHDPLPAAEGAEAKTPTATRDAESLPAPPTAAAAVESAMPASYRKALSGVRGRLVDADGKPVAGLQVELLELLPSALMGDYSSLFAGVAPKFPELSVAKGRSGDDGVFTLEGTHGAALHAVGVDLGGPRGTLRAIDRTLPSGEVVDLGDVVLGACVTWRGRVEDEDGKAVAGARVRATTLPALVFQPGVADVARAAGILPRVGPGPELIEFPEGLRAWESRLPLPTTQTGADGGFELSGVPQGIVTLVVDRDGFCGTFKGPSPTAKRDRDVGTIELSRGRDLSGVVVDAAGHPVAGVEVFGGVEIAAANLSLLFKTAPTGADGRFKIEHLSPLAGALSVVARANPLQAPTIVRVDDPDRAVTVTLPGTCSLGVWLKTADGAPVADEGTELWINPTNDFPPLTFAAPHRVPAAQIERAGAGHVVVHALAPGRFTLLGRASGFARATARCSIDAEAKEATEVTLEFVPAATVKVEVVDAATQAPIEWANVSATRGRREEGTLVSRRTDAKGEVELPEMPALSPAAGASKGDADSTVYLRAFHPAYAPQVRPLVPSSDPATGTAIRFELTPGASLHGRVHVGSGPPAEPVLFVLEPKDHRATSVDDNFPRMAVPGLDGTFEIKGLSPGSKGWTVMSRVFGGDMASALEKIPSMAMLRRGSVQLEEGKTAEVDVDLDPRMQDAPCKITGVVHVHGRRRPEMFTLQASSQTLGNNRQQSSKSVEVRPEQPFTLEVAGGWINLSLMEMDKPGEGGPKQIQVKTHYQSWFMLDPGQTQEITIDLEFVAAKLLVVDDAGSPAPHVYVNLNEVRNDSDSTSSTSASGQTGDDGSVDVEVPRPGLWRCQVSSPQLGRADAQFQFPSSGVERLVLSRGVPCSGRVDIPDDPGESVTFFLQFEPLSKNGDIDYQNGMGIQLGQGARTFDVVGLAPGKYRIQLYGARWSRDTVDIELPSAGVRDLVLRYRLEPPRKEDE